MSAQRQEERYVEEMGKQALERVQEVAATRHGCCWEPHEGPHHPVCSKFVALEVPEIHEAQESLL